MRLLKARPRRGTARRKCSSRAAPERQRAILSVLRREQRAADRGPQTAYALGFLGVSVSDVHTTSIRLPHGEPDGHGIVLIPVIPEHASPAMRRVLEPRLSEPDRLCLFAADQEGGRPAEGSAAAIGALACA